jgi:hypothetical protein
MSLAFFCLVPVGNSSLPSPRTGAPGMKKPDDADEALQRTIAQLRKADTDGDKRLSTAEIIAALPNKRTAAEIEKVVARFDRDGDKHLNLEEALAAVKSGVKP